MSRTGRDSSRSLLVVLFPGFEPLDAEGPITFFGRLPDMEVITAAPVKGSVAAANSGLKWAADFSLGELQGRHFDWLLVPGGMGTRPLIHDSHFLQQLKSLASGAALLMSVCTGAGLLAAAGVLDGKQATTNKRAFGWATSINAPVKWRAKARWVQDGNIFTAAGVAAGMDMAVEVVSQQYGSEMAQELARVAEYEPHREADWDPFAQMYGL